MKLQSGAVVTRAIAAGLLMGLVAASAVGCYKARAPKVDAIKAKAASRNVGQITARPLEHAQGREFRHHRGRDRIEGKTTGPVNVR